MSKGLKVRPEGSDTVNTGQVTLTSGAAQAIITLTQNRRAVLITNTSTGGPIYIGTSTISKTTGFFVGPSTAVSIPTNAAIYGTTSDATVAALVSYIEVL